MGKGSERELTAETLHQLVRELVPLLEAVSGQHFPTPPVVRTASRGELETVLVRELERQYSVLWPGRTPEAVQAAIAPLVAPFSQALVSKYAVDEQEVWVVPENLADLAECLEWPWLWTEAGWQILLLHELAHALDDQSGFLRPLLAQAHTFERMQIHSALVEGHAQFLAARVAERLGLLQAFEDLEREVFAFPAEESEGAPANQADPHGITEVDIFDLLPQLPGLIRLAYVEGRRFFEALAAERGPEAVKQALTHPPADLKQITVTNEETA